MMQIEEQNKLDQLLLSKFDQHAEYPHFNGDTSDLFALTTLAVNTGIKANPSEVLDSLFRTRVKVDKSMIAGIKSNVIPELARKKQAVLDSEAAESKARRDKQLQEEAERAEHAALHKYVDDNYLEAERAATRPNLSRDSKEWLTFGEVAKAVRGGKITLLGDIDTRRLPKPELVDGIYLWSAADIYKFVERKRRADRRVEGRG